MIVVDGVFNFTKNYYILFLCVCVYNCVRPALNFKIVYLAPGR